MAATDKIREIVKSSYIAPITAKSVLAIKLVNTNEKYIKKPILIRNIFFERMFSCIIFNCYVILNGF